MRVLFFAMIATALFTGCFEPTDISNNGNDDINVSTAVQDLSVCSSSCDAPTYNGVPVACATNYFCYSDAGAAYCYQGSYWVTTPCTIAPVLCGNGTCDAGETSSSCPSDCHCGNGTCEAVWGENTGNCPGDCPSTTTCGNGTCDSGESNANCPDDCYCGDGVCQVGERRACEDCGPYDCFGMAYCP